MLLLLAACADPPDPSIAAPSGPPPEERLVILHSQPVGDTWEADIIGGLKAELCRLGYALEPAIAPQVEPVCHSVPTAAGSAHTTSAFDLACGTEAPKRRLKVEARLAPAASAWTRDPGADGEVCDAVGRAVPVQDVPVLAIGLAARAAFESPDLAKQHPSVLATPSFPVSRPLGNLDWQVELRPDPAESNAYGAPLRRLGPLGYGTRVLLVSAASDDSGLAARADDAMRDAELECLGHSAVGVTCSRATVSSEAELLELVRAAAPGSPVCPACAPDVASHVDFIYPVDLRALARADRPLHAIESAVAAAAAVPVIGFDPASVSRGYSLTEGVAAAEFGRWAALAFDSAWSGSPTESVLRLREISILWCGARLRPEDSRRMFCEEEGDACLPERCPDR